MNTRLEKYQQDPEFKAAVEALQTMTFDLANPKEYQQFRNAIATLMNKGYAEGFNYGVVRAMQEVKNISNGSNQEGIMKIDRRDLDVIDQQRQRITENPEMPLSAGIEEINLSLSPYHLLKRAGINSVAEVVSKNKSEIMAVLAHSWTPDPDFNEIETQLEEFGYIIHEDAPISTENQAG